MKSTLSKYILAAALMVSPALAQTKACQLAMSNAKRQLATGPALVADLDSYTPATRPAVERALSAYLAAANAGMTLTCEETDASEAIAVLKATTTRTTQALIHYATVRGEATKGSR